ncbi:hypothetical protein [Rufibacter radiotolerans]|nr:hypothetical protein [Rufibacter radiotolerans]
MKSLPVLVFASLVLMGCAHTENLSSEQTPQFSAPFTLALEKPVTVGNLVVKLQKVEDSRCPMNAMCIRQGSAITYLQLQDTRGNEATKTLYLGDALPAPDNRGMRSADTVLVSMGPRQYQLILSEVQPYPNTANTSPAEKTAKIEVRAL